MDNDLILVIVVGTALAFDFTNGFHDTANVVATAISTRAIAPKPAVAMAALLNFVGAFLSLKVAATVGKGFVDTDALAAMTDDERKLAQSRIPMRRFGRPARSLGRLPANSA